nr:hypothetical protein GCM10020092_003820 [Actinoplanes digitatis]
MLLNGPGQVCLTHDGKDAENPEVGIRIGPTVAKGSPVGGAPAVPGGVQADLVYVPRGKGALVVAAASPTAPAGSGTVSIVTDIGRRYPVASREVLPRLGYGGVKPDPIPGQLVAPAAAGPGLGSGTRPAVGRHGRVKGGPAGPPFTVPSTRFSSCSCRSPSAPPSGCVAPRRSGRPLRRS